MTYREALNQALREEMHRDSRVFVIGEEIGLYEGAYKVTQGLLKEFGPQRIVDTPIAESGFSGVGIGAAMVVDPRTLRPMDTEAIVGSVRKTHRAVVVEAGAGFAGMGSEIAAFITEQAFDDLDAPVERVTGASAPMPYARNLERTKTPSKDEILEAIRKVCDAGGS